MDNGCEWKIGDLSSISSQIGYLHKRVYILRKGMKPSLSRTVVAYITRSSGLNRNTVTQTHLYLHAFGQRDR